jgi:hypothetical protein
MKTQLSILAIMLLMGTSAMAQKFITKNGEITFFSSTPIEDIEAHNKQVNAVLDAETGDFVFRVLIKAFQFEKALMQEHFNENYMESHKFPNSTFVGKVVNNSEIDWTKSGTVEATIEGELTIHGVTQKISEKGTFEVGKDGIKGMSKFEVKVADYDIKIPRAVVNNIAESIEVTVNVDLRPM